MMLVTMNLLVLKLLLQHLLILNLLHQDPLVLNLLLRDLPVLNLRLQFLLVLNLLLRDLLVLNPLLQDLLVLNLLLHLLDLRYKDPVQDLPIPDTILKTILTIRFQVIATSILTKAMTNYLLDLNLLFRDLLILNLLLRDLLILNILFHLLDLRCKDLVQDLLIPGSILKTNLNAAMKTIVKATIRFLVGAASILTKVMTNYLLDLNLLFRDLLVLNLPLRDLLVLNFLLHLLDLRCKDPVQDLPIPGSILKTILRIRFQI